MGFQELGINAPLAMRIQNSIANGSVVHAYIFEGDHRMDKLSVAKTFAKAVLCKNSVGIGCGTCPTCKKIDHNNYEDIYFAELSDKGSIRDEAIELLQERLKTRPIAGERNIAIIENADTMTPRAQNRLLKTLEEPAEGTIIILLSENTENLVQTIRSRCVIYRINDFAHPPKGEMSEKAEKIAEQLIAGAHFYELLESISDIQKSKAKVREFLDSLEYTYRNLLVERSAKSGLYKKQYIFDAIAAIESAKRDITANMKVDYVLKSLIIKIGK